ncbi:MAG: ABC transporter permease [Limnobacter sp.]|nr:ABC transporter permease [Limnobacter sp.]
MTPHFLITDILIWFLVFCVLIYIRQVVSSPLNRENWKLVFQSRIAASSAVVLAFASLITLVDSVHFKVNAEGQAKFGTPIISALDLALGPLAYQRETSYSAPLATRELSKKAIDTPKGPVRDYPRLKFGGKNLENESDKPLDLVKRAYKGVLAGGLLWTISLVLIWVYARQSTLAQAFATSGESKKMILKNEQSFFAGNPSRTAVIWTLFVIFIAGGILWQWAQAYHVLGTDKVGLDVLYGALKSLRTAMLIGLLTTLLTLPLGIGLGLAAGYFQGWVDDVIQYIYTTINSIPSVLLIAATILMLNVALEANPQLFSTSVEKADLRLFFLCAILGLTSWTGLARLLRGEVLKMREQDYILAARASGVSPMALLFSHLMPNLMHLILIATVMEFSGLVLAEAVLSYVGVGVDPTTFSFGTMINAARLELSREPVVWWSLMAAFVFMLVLVLAANLFADAVRDAFDPRARQLKQSLIRV